MHKIRPHDTEYGWKHGFLRPEDGVLCTDVLLVVARDAFSWVLKMFHEPYNMVFEEGMHEFGPFLRGKFRSQRWENPEYYRRRGVNCAFPMEEATSVIWMRTLKYKSLLSEEAPYFAVKSIEPRLVRSYIRYESLQQMGQTRAMTEFFRRHCIPHREPLKEIKDYRGYATEGKGFRRNRNFASGSANDDILAQFTVEELQFVLANLNLTFERRVLNYTYDHVEEHIRRRGEGALEYRGPPMLDHKLEIRRKNLARQFKMGTLDMT